MLKAFLENEYFKDLAGEVLYRTKALALNHPKHVIEGLKEYNSKIDIYFLMTHRDPTYEWSNMDNDIKLSLRQNPEKMSSAVKDIAKFNSFKKKFSNQIEEYKFIIKKETINKVREDLKRNEQHKQVHVFDLDFTPGASCSEDVISNLLTHHSLVSDFYLNYTDPIHLISLALLDKVLDVNNIWSITQAIQRHSKKYKFNFRVDNDDADIGIFYNYLIFMLKIFLKEISITEKMLSNQNLYSRLTTIVADYNGDSRNSKKIQHYAFQLLKELLLIDEFPREEVIDFVFNHAKMEKPISASTRSKLLQHLTQLQLISSTTSHANFSLNVQTLLGNQTLN